jgi:2-polyprenyl-3-methyl-5-hydroxy-6-metoxy-1,4-benzoquinol methylase
MNDIEEYYNNFYKELSRLDEIGNTFSKIEDFLPILEGNEKIIDLGCGHGGVSHELIKRGFDVYGVEINDEAIISLEQKGFKVFKKDINKPLNIEEKFNIVLILDVLEHLFDPFFLLNEAKKITKRGGAIIINVPLYFDILDRLKIFFTGSIISLDNLCYGEKNYLKFRSYNYDHIRFFRPKEIIEMGNNLGFKIDRIEYGPSGYYGKHRFIRLMVRLFINKYSVKIYPNILAHSMKIRWRMN